MWVRGLVYLDICHEENVPRVVACVGTDRNATDWTRLAVGSKLSLM